MLKAYRLNDYEAWAGEDLEDAISVAMKECGISREDAYDDCFGEEIPGDTEIKSEDGVTFNVGTILAEYEASGEKGVVCFFGDV
jgi:hypothetical protein